MQVRRLSTPLGAATIGLVALVSGASTNAAQDIPQKSVTMQGPDRAERPASVRLRLESDRATQPRSYCRTLRRDYSRHQTHSINAA